MNTADPKKYSITEIKGAPIIGSLLPILRSPLSFLQEGAESGTDIISYRVMGKDIIQINHPDIIRHILIDNHKNYKKSNIYIRFESAGGLGLITSHGEKWKRDRQKIQPLFSRELVTGYHYEVANEVSEKYKQKWLSLTRGGPVEIDITKELAAITTEVIMRVVFGRHIDDEMVKSLHDSYDILMDYLKNIRMIPDVDLRKKFHMPSYYRFKKALDNVDSIIKRLASKYRSEQTSDRRNMFTLLLDAQKNDPDHFDDREIRDHCVTMIFAGFETTSITMQWMWYVLSDRPDIMKKLREEIALCAPCTSTEDSSSLPFESVMKMDYLTAFFKETLRVYPSLWVTGREPLEDDQCGDFNIKKGTTLVLPQYVMHRHPKWWEKPEEFMPERFLPLDEKKFDEGLYFPFSHGPRKCSGSMFAELEAKTIMAKLLPLFDMMALNKAGNQFLPSLSLKLKHNLRARVTRHTA